MPFKIVRVGQNWKIYKLDDKKYAKPKFKTRQAAVNQARNWIRYAHRSPFRIKKVGMYWRIYKPSSKKYFKSKYKTRVAAQNQANNWLRYARNR